MDTDKLIADDIATVRDEVRFAMLHEGFALYPNGGNLTIWRKPLDGDRCILLSAGEDGSEIDADPLSPEWLASVHWEEHSDPLAEIGPAELAEVLGWCSTMR